MKSTIFHQPAFDIDLNIDPGFGYWLAGFVDGEGCFMIKPRKRGNGKRRCNVVFKIGLRIDDMHILYEIKNTLRCGRISKENPTDGKNPKVKYEVNKVSALKHIIIPLFNTHPLRAKKARDFEIWKQAVEISLITKQIATGHGNSIPDHLWTQFQDLHKQLQAIRQCDIEACLQEYERIENDLGGKNNEFN